LQLQQSAMQFGKSDHLDGFPAGHFTLPPDPPQTQRVLAAAGAGPLDVRVGGTLWNVPAWRGSLYPARTPQREWPTHYGRHFGTLEFNATHYRIYPPEKMAAWAAALPEDFLFCPKFPQIITHFRRFRQCDGPTDDFIQGLLALGKRLGPSFIQLPPQFAPTQVEPLLDYLARWPRELPLAIEFRHPDWFSGHPHAEAVWSAMEEYGIGSVLSDTALRRDAVHMRLTAPFILVRFGGGDGHPTDASRLTDWADRLRAWGAAGLRGFYFLIHQPDSIRTPETALTFAQAWKTAAPDAPAVRAPQLASTLFSESD
jgi:uncharacterized protein YecE (DUF72 family)